MQLLNYSFYSLTQYKTVPYEVQSDFKYKLQKLKKKVRR